MSLALFILLGVIWSFSFVAIKIVISEINPLWGASFRIVLALCFLSIIYWVLKKSFGVSSSYRWKIWFVGLFMQAIPFVLLFSGEKLISAGLAGIVNGTVPLWTLLLAWIFLKDHELFSTKKIFGLCLGFFGILIVYVPKLASSGPVVSPGAHLGILLVLLMSLSYGIGAVFNKKMISAKVNRYGMLYQQHVSSSIFIILFSLIFVGIPTVPKHPIPVGSALLYLSLVSSAIAWIIYFYLLEHWGAVGTSTITYFLPVGALITDFLFFRTIPTISECLGACAILYGIALTHTRIKSLQSV